MANQNKSRALAHGENWINGPIGPPCQNKYFDYLFSGLEPPRAESPSKQPHVLDRWSLWFSEQWK